MKLISLKTIYTHFQLLTTQAIPLKNVKKILKKAVPNPTRPEFSSVSGALNILYT